MPTAKSGTQPQAINYLRSAGCQPAFLPCQPTARHSSHVLAYRDLAYGERCPIRSPESNRGTKFGSKDSSKIKRGPANGTPMLYPPVSDSGAAESAHPGKKRQPPVILHAPCHST